MAQLKVLALMLLQVFCLAMYERPMYYSLEDSLLLLSVEFSSLQMGLTEPRLNEVN